MHWQFNLSKAREKMTWIYPKIDNESGCLSTSPNKLDGRLTRHWATVSAQVPKKPTKGSRFSGNPRSGWTSMPWPSPQQISEDQVMRDSFLVSAVESSCIAHQSIERFSLFSLHYNNVKEEL